MIFSESRLPVFRIMLGFYPAPILGRAANTVRDMNELVNPPGPDQIAARD